MAKESPEQLSYTGGSAAKATDLPRQTIDAAVKSGELPAVKAGKRFIILRTDLLAWLERCKQRGAFPSFTTDDDRERLAQLNRARKAAA